MSFVLCAFDSSKYGILAVISKLFLHYFTALLPYYVSLRMGAKEGSKIDGLWLKKAIKAQGETFRSVAKQLGYKSTDKYNEHAQGKAHLSAESLAELARLFPTLNVRYVLTGEGSPLL